MSSSNGSKCKNMTIRQRLLKIGYPFLMWLVRKHAQVYQNPTTLPPVSFYDLSTELSDGTCFHFSALSGKMVLIVNTASDCGYTAQYERLQMLADQYNEKLVVIAFPSNDFKEQEQHTDHAIEQFCRLHYKVRFMLARKSQVRKGDNQNPVFKWLTNATNNGWNDRAPQWNFTKYLVNASGQLTHTMDPGIDPMGMKMKSAMRS